jgi:Zn-dependent peptidase ImmA (M78 family)
MPALVKPELLVWARESSGLSQQAAAAKLKQPLERLSLWEAGEDNPTVPQLRKLAHIYKRPLAAFYLPRPPVDVEPIHDFRQLDSTISRSYSPELRALIRDVQQRRETAIDLAVALEGLPERFPVTASLQDSPETIAQHLREAIGIPYEEQIRWKNPHDALKYWRQGIEALGVLVFQASEVPLAEMRGFSLSDHPFPAIVINGKDFPNSRIFTLMHELTHIALRIGGLCNLEEVPKPVNEDQQTEIFCNHVAGAILVPRETLMAESPVQFADPAQDFSDHDLAHLARRYQVSQEVITRRLLILGQVSPAFYQKKRQEFLADYQKSAEKTTTGSPVPILRRTLAKHGYAYSRSVLDAYNSDRITASEVSSYLNMNLKHLPQLEATLTQTQ